MPSSNIDIDLTGDALSILKQLKAEFTSLNSKVDFLEQNTKASFKGIKNSLSQISLVSITQGFENFKNTLSSINAPGLNFESQMADLSAITGIVGDDLDFLGEKARENAKIYGGEAAESVEVYKLLLSQLSPELAKYPEVLGGMADSVSVLSKTMGGDTAGAVEVLTTAMNQYGISMDDPIQAQKELNEMMNAMAAGAQAGSAELPQLKEAIQNVGGDAKSSGLEFEELVAAIEALDKAGKKGSEGGTALRNILASLNQGRFLPKDVQQELQGAGIDIEALSDKSLDFTERLRLLNPIVNDSALLSKLFGKENKLAAEALINSVDAQDAMTLAITGTTTAQEQANVIMDTRSEKLARINAWFEDIKIGISNATGSFLPFLEISFGALQSLSTIVPAIKSITTAVNFLTVAENRLIIAQKLRNMWTTLTSISTMKMIAITKLQSTWTGIVTAAQWLWNLAMTMNPIGIIITAIGALVAGIVWLTSSFSGFGDFFTNFWENLKQWFWNLVNFWNEYLNPFTWLLNLIDEVFPGAKAAITGFFSDLWDSIYAIFFQPWVDAWNATMGWIFGDQNLDGEVSHVITDGRSKTSDQLDDGVYQLSLLDRTIDEKMQIFSDRIANIDMTDEERQTLTQEARERLVALETKKQQASDKRAINSKYGDMPYTNNVTSSNKSATNTKGAGFASAEKKEINTTIDKLVNNLIINVPKVDLSPAKIREMISETLIGAVRDFEVTVN